MPRRSFQRSQSLALPPSDLSERAFRRATRELRDFHRARSLDVILEEDDSQNSSGGGSGMLKKKGACLCLADLVAEENNQQQQDADGSENTSERELEEDQEQQHNFAGSSGSLENGNGCWGHFTADSPSSSTAETDLAFHHHHPTNHHHRTRLYPAFTIKGRTIRRFAKS